MPLIQAISLALGLKIKVLKLVDLSQEATVYTHLELKLKILHWPPLVPPILGGNSTQSPLAYSPRGIQENEI